MFSLGCVIFCFVFAGQSSGLVELPKVDDNSILTTEVAVRDTVNTLFYTLGLRGIKTKPRLKEYSAVHKNLVAFTLQDYTTLKEIARLTRVNKMKINNETWSFMTIINELLNEDVVEEITEPSSIEAKNNEDNVLTYIDRFLTKLETLKEQYGVTNEKFHIKEDIYQVLKDNEVLSYNFTADNYNSDSKENETLLLESNFWKPDVSGRRIYRGDRTKIKHFPFMASIQIFNRFHCGGSIIKSDLIITASSCLQLAWNNRFFRENPAFLSARVGSNFYNGGGENIPILEVYFHPEYDPKNLRNNICLLRLVRNLHFRKRSRRIKKIDFDRHASALPYTTDGITIVGWGARDVSNIVGNPWINALAYAVLDIYPLRECQDVYSREYVSNKNFCAGFFSKGGGACNHDVGGPGIVNGILAGVVSFGSPICGAPDAPTVFTKVGYYTDWIETIMEQDVPKGNQQTTLKKKLFTFGEFYRPVPQTTPFKIAPIGGKLKAIPIHEVDALRMLQDGNLFKEFLGTMFSDDEAVKYQDLLQETPDAQAQDLNNELRTDETEQNTALPTLSKPFEASDLEVEPKNFMTLIKTTSMPLIEELTEDPIQEVTEDPIPIATQLDLYEPQHRIPALLHQVAPTADRSTIQKIDKNNEFERDLANLIEELDLSQLIEGVPSVEDDKLLEKENILDILQPQDAKDELKQLDDSFLTLLYLSDTEKVANDNIGEVGVDDDYEDSADDEAIEGLSIPVDNFLRSQNTAKK